MALALTGEEMAYFAAKKQQNIDLLCTVARIPAPLNGERERAQFILRYFQQLGAFNGYIDQALNVVFPFNCEGKEQITVICAHTDVVFPDTEPLPIHIDGQGIMHGPGCGDNSAAVAALMLVHQYVLERGLSPREGVLVVYNSGEEGLGNLKGIRQIMQDYEGRIKEVLAIDTGFVHTFDTAIGSKRYRLTVKTEGGHSYTDFGHRNAIFYATQMIRDLYAKKVPTQAVTTYNVGMVEGGTSVNTIAQQASFLYEYRSTHRDCLAEMDRFLDGVVRSYRAMGIGVQVELVGSRPCAGEFDNSALKQMVLEAYAACGAPFTGWTPSSGDAIIPMSLGIPAVGFGVCQGGGVHTREEWLDTASLPTGLAVTACLMLHYFR